MNAHLSRWEPVDFAVDEEFANKHRPALRLRLDVVRFLARAALPRVRYGHAERNAQDS